MDKPWSGKPRVQATDVSRKGKEKVFEPLDIFASHSIMDGGDSSGSEMSLDEEFGIPAMKTPWCKEGYGSHECKVAQVYESEESNTKVCV